MALSIQVGTTIKAPQQKVFDFLTDPSLHPRVIPGLIEIAAVPPLPLQVGNCYRYKYQMFGVVLEGVWTVATIVSPTCYEGNTTGDIASHWRYEVVEQADGAHVTLAIEYEPPQTVLGRIQQGILKRINEKAAETFMHNLQLILEPLN